MLDAIAFYTPMCLSRKHRLSCVAYAKAKLSLSRARNGCASLAERNWGSLPRAVARSLPWCRHTKECATIMYGRSLWLAVKAREFVVFSSSFVVEPD